jgi:hypothetical protein
MMVFTIVRYPNEIIGISETIEEANKEIKNLSTQSNEDEFYLDCVELEIKKIDSVLQILNNFDNESLYKIMYHIQTNIIKKRGVNDD